MRETVTKTQRRQHTNAVWVAGLVSGIALCFLAGCGNDSVRGENVLPGRSRPLLKHDWPHPRDYKFGRSEFRPPDPTRTFVKSQTGVRAYILPDPSDYVVRLTAVAPLGRLYERSEEEGASRLIIRMLTGPSPAIAPTSLSLRLESLGTQLRIEEWLDVTSFSLEVLPEDWREGLELIIDTIRTPNFDDTVIRRYRSDLGHESATFGVVGDGFRPKVELERILVGYPLAPPLPGLEVRPEAVRALASRAFAADRIVLGIGGNVVRSEIEAALDDLTRDWAQGTETPRLASLAHLLPRGKALHTIDTPSLEGWIAIGRVIDAVPESDRGAMAVLADLVSTRLNIATREVRGLANRNILVLPETVAGAGLLHIRTGGRPEAVAPLVRFSLDELARICAPDAVITDEEFERAKGSLILAGWQAALDGSRVAARTYALETVRHGDVERLLRWPEAVQAVSKTQVKSMAQRYLDPSQMLTVIVGPVDRIRQARHPRWPIMLDGLRLSPTTP